MGSDCYYTAYQQQIEVVLQDLREREFRAGRYNPALRAAKPPTYTFQHAFPPGPSFPSPGAQHVSIDVAFAASGSSGTGSILDIAGVSPTPSFRHASPLSPADRRKIFESESPTRANIDVIFLRGDRDSWAPDRIQKSSAFWDRINRGEARRAM